MLLCMINVFAAFKSTASESRTVASSPLAMLSSFKSTAARREALT
eukprot:CAMPEP_0171924474 /NCGR_PEP_ID=MMETSP0993-20121228/23012_1 /TAXON_ID=483369 /ORGANISM="non described non described, Strain CCMP2098" /LENGTH=44 /DNA_ID= /DNA_START= /DNA_END= /DNA_ORIENTATION=